MESYQFFVGSLGEDYEPFGEGDQQQGKEGDEREEEQGEEEDDLNDTHSRDALIDEVGALRGQEAVWLDVIPQCVMFRSNTHSSQLAH